MNKRERVIVALMGVTVGYGVLVFLMPSATTSAASSVPELSEANALRFVTEGSAQLDAAACEKEARYIESCLQSTWTNNPFAAHASIASATAAAPMQPVKFSGYVEMDGQHYAVLDGRSYARGDSIGDGAYTVASIDPEQVVLTVGDGEESVVLTIMNQEKKRGAR